MIKVVELKDLTLGYNKVLFSGINATAHEGELIAIIGPNGMGKSTLLKSISSIIGVMGGEISLFAKSVDSYSHKEIASVLSLVPSNSPRTGNLSLFDMISAGTYNRTGWMGNLDDAERQNVLAVIEKVGLERYVYSDSSKLSDGEFQRAAIARSLVQQSKIILLDEPTAFLDIENKSLIIKLLKSIARDEGKSVIFSTHDLPLAIQMCDKIWVMGHGGFFEGTPNQLIEEGVFDTMFKDSSLRFDKKLLTLL